MRKLPYATGYFSYSSEPAIELAAKLVEIAPAGLQHVYLTLGGSEAVDAAVRLIVQYYNSTGRPNKKQFISLQRGYHGSSSTGAGLTALPASTAASTCRGRSSTTSPRPTPIAARWAATRRPSSSPRWRRCATR